MAKVIIPVKDLPPPKPNGDHVFRFRAITKDNNNTSQWSKLYKIESIGQKNAASVQYLLTATSSNGPYEVTWDPEVYIPALQIDTSKNELQDYDIFTQFNSSGSLVFYGRVIGNKATIYYSSPLTQLRIVCQLPTLPTPPSYSTNFTIFDTGLITL